MAYSVGNAVREVKKQTDNSYFLSGDDYFLQKFFITNLNKINNNEYNTRYLNFSEELDVKIFLEEITSISLFQNKNIFILRNIEKISKDDKDLILKYLDNPNNSIVTIFTSNDFYSKNKFFSSLMKKMKTIDTRTPFPNKIREWVKYYLKVQKIDIDYSFLDDIIFSNNDEIMTIINEVEKLYLENECKKIEFNNDSKLLRSNKNIRPWFLQDSLGDKNVKKSIRNIELLQYAGYSIIPIIINLYSFFNHMLLSYENSSNTGVSQYGLNKIINSNLNKYLNKYSKSEIINILIDLKNIDVLIKTTSLNQNNLLYIFIIKICQGYYG